MAIQAVEKPAWAEIDPAALRGLFFDLGYALASLRFSLASPVCLSAGESTDTLFAELERVFKKIGQMQLAGCGRLANHLAADLERYFVNTGVRWEAYGRSAKQSKSSGLIDSREAQFKESFLGLWAAVWHASHRNDKTLPQCAWICVGLQAARCERLNDLAKQDESSRRHSTPASLGGQQNSPESDPAEGRETEEGGGYYGIEGLELALRRAGYDVNLARRSFEKAGIGSMGPRNPAGGYSTYGRLRDVLRKKIRLDSPFFWEELPDGYFRVAGTEVSYERYQIMGALRIADGEGFNCRELKARTGFPSVDNHMGFLRRHPIFRAFLTERGERAWIEMDAPMPPASLAARLKPLSNRRRAPVA